MNKICRIVVPAVFALTLAHSSVVAAENDKLAEAGKLYIQAVPMAMDSPERAQLLQQAETLLKASIAENPQSLEAHRKLVGVYLLQQDYTNGIRAMQEVITLSPEDPKLFIALAFLYEHSGAYGYSEAMLNHALELDPDNELAKEYLTEMRKKMDARESYQDPHGAMGMMEKGQPGHGVMQMEAVHGNAAASTTQSATPEQ